MPTKAKRTNQELQALIMQEVRRRPECHNVKGVAIIRPVQTAAHHPNWDVSWSLDGPGPHRFPPRKLRKSYVTSLI